MNNIDPSSSQIKTDQISDIDLLDRKRFAKEIANNILQYNKISNDSLVIGIHGPWGSGKSTLLHFIKTEICQNSILLPSVIQNRDRGLFQRLKFKSTKSPTGLHILEFNPWMFSGKEELHSIFLNEFALKVSSKKQKLRKLLRSFSTKFNWIDDVSKLGMIAKNTIAEVADISLEDLKIETNKILVDNEIRVIVFMDDIDRLSPNEIIEIFQLIKLNANFKNTVFVIAFDKSVVIDSIKNQYGVDGEKYLEKIVQVDYSLPSVLPEDIETIFFNQLQSLIELHSISFEIKTINTAWLVEGLRHYFRNIRDINRYFNSLNFRLPGFHKNLNVHDFLIIEAIRLFDYESYELIRNNYRESDQYGKESHFRQELEKINKGKSRTLFRYLFEKRSSNKDYKIADPDFFDRYFSLSVSKKDMREEEFTSFLQHIETRSKLLDNIVKNGRIEFLLRRLSTKDIIPHNIDQIQLISPLISIWNNYREEFVRHWRSVWWALKTIVSINQDPNMAFRLLIDEINMTDQDFGPARFVYMWLLLQNAEVEDDKNIDKDLLPYIDIIKSSRKILKELLKLYFKTITPTFSLVVNLILSIREFSGRAMQSIILELT